MRLVPLTSEFLDLLRCPSDGRPLRLSEGELVCTDGGRFAIIGGIPNLAPSEHDPVEFRDDRLERLAELEDWHFWFRGRAALVDELLQRALPNPGLVLDVGCGNGAGLAGLARSGHHAVCVDLLLAGLERARARAPAAWLVRGSVDRLPFPDGRFDGAILLDVLEHVDDRAALVEVHRVLRPGGALLASVPAAPWLWSYRDVDAGHRRRYSRGDLRRLVIGAGFRLEQLRTYQALMFPVAAAARLLGRRGPATRDLEERPSPALNRALGGVTSAELALGRFVHLPWGLSLIVVARKP